MLKNKNNKRNRRTARYGRKKSKLGNIMGKIDCGSNDDCIHPYRCKELTCKSPDVPPNRRLS